MKKLLTFFILILLTIKTYGAEKVLYIEEEINQAVNGEEKLHRKRTYYGINKILIDDSSQNYNVLIDIKKKKVFLINTPFRSYSELNLEKFVDLSKQSNLISSLSDNDIKIKETGRKRKIGKYKCFEVIVMIEKFGMRTESWLATPGIPLNNYFNFTKNTGLGASSQKLLNYQKKKNAYTISSITTPTSYKRAFDKIEVNIKKIALVKPSSAVFEIPKTFKKIDIKD